jgi:hypothetical protein
MRTKYLLLGLVALVVAAAAWTAWTVWHVRHQLVTLDVRETPLTTVLRKIEWQTWTKIRAEKSVEDTHITLHAAGKPLRDVLNSLSQQADARVSTVYAVFSSTRALKALDMAMSGDGKIERFVRR